MFSVMGGKILGAKSICVGLSALNGVVLVLTYINQSVSSLTSFAAARNTSCTHNEDLQLSHGSVRARLLPHRSDQRMNIAACTFATTN